MPFVGDDVDSGRKRRWTEDDERNMLKLYAAAEEPKDFFLINQRAEHSNRKVLPLSKRARMGDELPINTDSPPPPFSHRRRRSSQLRVVQIQPTFAAKPPPRPNSTLLAPCHICHRKPTKKSDLDSFAQCQGCGEQTCFVCIRQCHGWNLEDGSILPEQEALSRSFHMDDIDDLQSEEHNEKSRDSNSITRKGWAAGGHRTVVCSRCCIERGAEGDVACLGCLSRMEGT